MCTVDDLDDTIGDEEIEAIDTHTCDMYYYRNDAWGKNDNADDVKPLYLRRKSDPPVVPNPVAKEVDGGTLIPAGFAKLCLTKMPLVTKWIPHSATFSGIDLQIPTLMGENDDN